MVPIIITIPMLLTIGAAEPIEIAPVIDPVRTYLYPTLPPPIIAEPTNVPTILPSIPKIIENLA
jgi:hypothetical protein